MRAATAALYLFAVVVSAALSPFGAAQAHGLLDPSAICSATGTPPPDPTEPTAAPSQDCTCPTSGGCCATNVPFGCGTPESARDAPRKNAHAARSGPSRIAASVLDHQRTPRAPPAHS